MSETITWNELVEIEPRLAALERELAKVKDPGGDTAFCANEHWYGKNGGVCYRDLLIGLVGFHARNRDTRLQSYHAYQLDYIHLQDQLPDCRGCGCVYKVSEEAEAV